MVRNAAKSEVIILKMLTYPSDGRQSQTTIGSHCVRSQTCLREEHCLIDQHASKEDDQLPNSNSNKSYPYSKHGETSGDAGSVLLKNSGSAALIVQ